MKKVLFIAAVTVLGLTSCKKTWMCECKWSYNTTLDGIVDTKKNAQTACEAKSNATVGKTCTLLSH